MSDKIKDEFLELLRSTERDGVEDMIEELQSNGFMDAPASAGHHLNVAGGLVEHSLNTCKSALAIWEGMKTLNPSLEKSTPKDSVIIASLLHDVCKSDVYFRTVKKKKTALGHNRSAATSRARRRKLVCHLCRTTSERTR